MRAVLLRAFGPPSELVPAEVTDAVAGAGQVVIDVAVAGITFVETQLRAGRPPRPEMAPTLPTILGNGVGGVVSAVGADADPSLIGRRVVSSTGGSGGYAEKASVAVAGLIEVPASLSLPEAVTLLADGRTAMALARAAKLRPGETVLVEAAAGGVGSLLVQLAVSSGARVIAGVSTPRKAEVAGKLGATITAHYTVPGWDAYEVDVVFDGVGGDIGEAAYRMLRSGGRFFGYGMASGSFAPAVANRPDVTMTRGVPVTRDQMREVTIAALAEAAAGRLRPIIGQTFPLDQAAEAHAAIESRATVGKTLLGVR